MHTSEIDGYFKMSPYHKLKELICWLYYNDHYYSYYNYKQKALIKCKLSPGLFPKVWDFFLPPEYNQKINLNYNLKMYLPSSFG